MLRAGIAGVRAVTVTERADPAACAGGHRTTADAQEVQCEASPARTSQSKCD